MSKVNKTGVSKKNARDVLRVVRRGLVLGMGEPKPGKMCVEAAVCYALGLPHSDDPPCVSQAVRNYKIELNDSNWSSDKARARGMERIAIAQLGSDGIDEKAFAKALLKGMARKMVPAIVDQILEGRYFTEDEVKKIKRAVIRCKQRYDLASFESLSSLTDDNSIVISHLKDAASYANSLASRLFHIQRAVDWSEESLGDVALRLAAEIGVSALREVGSPGCKWLDLTRKTSSNKKRKKAAR